MITILFRMKIRDGKEKAALASMRAMIEAAQDEPGTLAYVYHRSQDDPASVVLYEAYADNDALQAHVKSSAMAAFKGRVAELFDTSEIKVDGLERIAGFVRDA